MSNDKAVFIDEQELVLRMIEAAYELARPDNMTAEEFWNTFDKDLLLPFRCAGRAAVEYMYQCISAGEAGHSLTYHTTPKHAH